MYIVVFPSYRLSTISKVSFPVVLGPARTGLVSSRHKVVPIGAPVRPHWAALPSVPVLHVAEDPLELLAVLRLCVTEHLGQRVPGVGGRLVSKIAASLVTDWHGVVAVGRERSDQTPGGVGIFTGLRPATHRPQASLGTGLGDSPFTHPDTVSHGNFVVFIALVSVQQDLVGSRCTSWCSCSCSCRTIITPLGTTGDWILNSLPPVGTQKKITEPVMIKTKIKTRNQENSFFLRRTSVVMVIFLVTLLALSSSWSSSLRLEYCII